MSAHGYEPPNAPSGPAPLEGALLGPLDALMRRLNDLLVFLSSLALVAASVILSYSVFARYVWKVPTYWQDEAAVFLLVGATFLTAGYVQQQRGHVGIQALVGLLPPAVNRLRVLLVDLASLLFCGFFALKSWHLFHEALVEGQVSSSTWAPPLAIPYGIMSLGMTILCLQLGLQLLAGLAGKVRP
jgi:TRAP-type C4-dicarboxylate transport system permease small subunit